MRSISPALRPRRRRAGDCIACGGSIFSRSICNRVLAAGGPRRGRRLAETKSRICGESQ
jgi:hypothetical protein